MWLALGVECFPIRPFQFISFLKISFFFSFFFFTNWYLLIFDACNFSLFFFIYISYFFLLSFLYRNLSVDIWFIIFLLLFSLLFMICYSSRLKCHPLLSACSGTCVTPCIVRGFGKRPVPQPRPSILRSGDSKVRIEESFKIPSSTSSSSFPAQALVTCVAILL